MVHAKHDITQALTFFGRFKDTSLSNTESTERIASLIHGSSRFQIVDHILLPSEPNV